MNSTQRLLTALRHKIPDRVPWSALVNNYFLDVQEKKYKTMDMTSFLKYVGADVFTWLGFNSVGKNVKVETYINGRLYKSQEGGNWLNEFYDYLVGLDYYKGEDGRVVERRFITPVGVLSQECTFKASSNSVFISQFPIKKVEDYNVFAYMINDLEYEIDNDSIQKEVGRIGDNGLGVLFLHATPVYELISCFVGLEPFHYLFSDYKKETIRLLNTMFDKYVECYKLYCQARVSAILIPEDTSTTLYSPGFFDSYLKPVIAEYCRIIKEAGKIPIIHACGHLKNLLKSLAATGVECVESMSPPPTGNISVCEFKKMAPQVSVMGGIPATVFAADLLEFKDYVKNLLLTNKAGGNFILSSGDSVPADAKLDNIKAVPELIEEYGRY